MQSKVLRLLASANSDVVSNTLSAGHTAALHSMHRAPLHSHVRTQGQEEWTTHCVLNTAALRSGALRPTAHASSGGLTGHAGRLRLLKAMPLNREGARCSSLPPSFGVECRWSARSRYGSSAGHSAGHWTQGTSANPRGGGISAELGAGISTQPGDHAVLAATAMDSFKAAA
jgi:hypothetical protein